MPSKQFEHLQESSLKRLAALFPSSCPLMVQRMPRGFRAMTIDERDEKAGRFEVVAAWITGYVAAWRRVRPTTQAIGRRL